MERWEATQTAHKDYKKLVADYRLKKEADKKAAKKEAKTAAPAVKPTPAQK